MTYGLPTAENPAVLLCGDARGTLRRLPAGCAQCVVTSTPYWGAQRDYEMPAQLGMEKTPEQFVRSLVGVFREVRRVLRKDGVLWLNIGDSYAASGKGGGGKMMLSRGHKWGHRAHLKGWRSPPPGYKQKDLVGVPWMLASALRKDGWTLRRDVVWDKGSATEPTRADRPTASHEFVFLFSQGIRYRFDAGALPHGSVWRVQPQGFDGHPAAFPAGLVRPMIRAATKPSDLVLDPFAGSGTAIVEAICLERFGVGIDLNPAYVELARERVAGPIGVGGLFDPSRRPDLFTEDAA